MYCRFVPAPKRRQKLSTANDPPAGRQSNNCRKPDPALRSWEETRPEFDGAKFSFTRASATWYLYETRRLRSPGGVRDAFSD